MTIKPSKIARSAETKKTIKAKVTKRTLVPKFDTDSRSGKLERIRAGAGRPITDAQKAKKPSRAAETKDANVDAEPKAKKLSPDAGRGNLSAESRKSLNPQPILNKKAEIAQNAGGKFFFNRTGRVWSLITSAGADLTLTAKEVAALSYDEFTTACKLGKLPIGDEKVDDAGTR